MIRRLIFRGVLNKDNDKIIGKNMCLSLRNYYCPKLHSEKNSCKKKLSYSYDSINIDEFNKRLLKHEKTINLLYCEFQNHKTFIKNELYKLESSSKMSHQKHDKEEVFVRPDV